jgi:Ran GTPase-activating protein (RanGAP) involved in mRNA processing and transport
MKKFLQKNVRLVHINLSGCEYGDCLVNVAEDMANAHSLQGIHLSDNSISEKALKEILKLFGIKLNS